MHMVSPVQPKQLNLQQLATVANTLLKNDASIRQSSPTIGIKCSNTL